MKLVEIKAFSNGMHRSTITKTEIIPEGCAVIPDDMETPNFPFGELEVEEIDGVMTVTKWTPLPSPNKETVISPFEQLRADIDFIAIMTGVDLI